MTQTQDFQALLGRVPSGLFIVTAAYEERRTAYLASFVQQASFEPLIFSIACHPARPPYTLIQKSGRFGLNLIPENDKILLKTFAKGHGPDEDPFASVSYEEVDGVVLLKDALGGAVFKVVSEFKPGDHSLFFGEALSGKIFDTHAKPWVHTRKSALNY
jgi:flavin reductase (DIM6/NTAB) family NADH-FMN oxidoreductase RutF